jgi:hypothetical protein
MSVTSMSLSSTRAASAKRECAEELPKPLQRTPGISFGRPFRDIQFGNVVTPKPSLHVITAGDANTAIGLQDRRRGDAAEHLKPPAPHEAVHGDKSGPVIGRIMRHPQAPEGQPWFWTITAREQPPSVYNRGYAASREQAMADFKARWVATPRPSFR